MEKFCLILKMLTPEANNKEQKVLKFGMKAAKLSTVQIIAVSVLTTILTDKFLITRPTVVEPVPAVLSETDATKGAEPTMGAGETGPVTEEPTPAVQGSQNEIILKEIQNLRKDMVSTLNEMKTKEQATVPTLNPSLIGGMVKVSSPQWKYVDVFEKPLNGSKIISSLTYDTVYFYSQKVNGWYQLSLDGNVTGWTQEQYLKEFP